MDPNPQRLTALPEALGKFQAEHHAAGKDGKGNYGTYTTLAGALAAIKPAIAYGLSHSQTLHPLSDDLMVCRTTLFHVGGESITSELPFPIRLEGRGSAMQALGSAITYARRYSLLAIYGLAGDDDDGEDAGVAKPATAAQPPAPPARPAAAPRRPAQPPAPPKHQAPAGEPLPQEEIDLLIATVKDLPPGDAKALNLAFRQAFSVPDGQQTSAFISTSAHRDWITNYVTKLPVPA